jgi:hypothetical protein
LLINNTKWRQFETISCIKIIISFICILKKGSNVKLVHKYSIYDTFSTHFVSQQVFSIKNFHFKFIVEVMNVAIFGRHLEFSNFATSFFFQILSLVIDLYKKQTSLSGTLRITLSNGVHFSTVVNF